ncbi:MAG: hypothetical protein AAF404_10600 [Pseudomonadota bacterium]
MRASIKRWLIWCSALLMMWQQVALAQTGIAEVDIDIDPPVIDHEALEVGVAGESQLISAIVIDDRGIEYVDLYYRPPGSREYSKTSMQRNGESQYIATVPTQLAQSSIEYYIEAADTGGNRVLKGFPFFPLIRNLDKPAPPEPLVTTSTSVESTAGQERSKLLYLLLGALAVGLLASAGSSGDGGGGGGGGEQVPLTINISSPTN